MAKSEKELRKERVHATNASYATFLRSPAGKDLIEFLTKTRDGAHLAAEERQVFNAEGDPTVQTLDPTTMAMLLGSAKTARDITAYIERRAKNIDK